jgi:predicted transcriptional regulator
VKWVNSSDVRSAVVDEVAGETLGTDVLLETVEASESAVYAALSDLERRGIVDERETGWTVTGRGHVVADLLAQRGAVEQLFAGEGDYWQTHDVSVLPEPFRLRLGALSDYEEIEISRTDPQRVVRTLSKVIAGSEWAWILAPIYQAEYARALPDNDESRLVLDPAVVQDALASIDDPGADEPERTEIRIGEAPLGLTVTPSAVLVSFPTLDGQYDTRTELSAESERARQWGRDLFEHYWEQAMPIPDG